MLRQNPARHALVISLLVVAGIWHLGANSMIACGFLGAWFIHLGSRPSLRQAGLALCQDWAEGKRLSEGRAEHSTYVLVCR